MADTDFGRLVSRPHMFVALIRIRSKICRFSRMIADAPSARAYPHRIAWDTAGDGAPLIGAPFMSEREFMRYSVALCGLLALAAASPAAAEGFRAEVHGGWDRLSTNDMEDSGVVYGVGFGYDWNVGGNGFVGLDFSVDDSTMKECETSALVANDRLCVRAGRDLAAGIRGGFNVSPDGKLYALAGYTNARFKASYTTPAGVTTRDAENLDGFRLGAGYQHALGSQAYGKVEYRYSNYEADTSRHQVLVGLGMNF